MNKRFLMAAGAAAVVFGGAFAFAADITVTSDDLGAGGSEVTTCTADADVDYVLTIDDTDGYRVPTVVVNTSGDCADHQVHVTLHNDADGIIANGEAAVDDSDDVTEVTMSSAQLAADIDHVDVAVYSTSSTGPTTIP